MNPNNVTNITAAAPQAVAKFSITCQIDGFSVIVEVEGKADSLRAIGATPVQTPAPEPTKAAGAATCPVHHSPMKPSRKPGKFYCAKKAEDGEYCREVA